MIMPPNASGLRLALLVILATLSFQLVAQDPPGTDVYLLTLPENPDDRLEGNPVNITARAGYDNQPAFTPDGSGLWFTRIQGGQADIYRYELGDGTTARATDTAESEYSPTPRPGHTGFTVVRVEPDQRQRLWHFFPDAEPQLLFPGLEPVGYFDWQDENRVVAFVLGTPMTLQTIAGSGDAEVLAAEIGRSIRRLPDGRIAFVDKSADPWRIRAVTLPEGTITTVANIPGQFEDFAVGPDGAIWMGFGARLHRWTETDGWQEVADLKPYGLAELTRLAVSPDGRKIAVVAAE